MERFKSLRRVQVTSSQTLDEPAPDNNGDREEKEGSTEKEEEEEKKVREDLVHFMGMKVRRRASILKECRGDYIGVPSDPYLTKILSKQGDNTVLFADTVLKFTGSGKMKRRILLITDFAIYLVDPDADSLKRRIALAAVDKLCMSELSDNFFAIIIPTEYDCLMASTRKAEIVSVILEATRSTSEYELEVISSNRFEYNPAADMVKEIHFEEVDGSIRTRISKKESQS
ncbi:myosin ID heavy chain [Iris pallida]|uniref:Myosin ID heavy chain n=1 Tax=Iris pallida TaxID=29817 RepID=A0AAX6EXZ6_IRIPA|nr:myosin ID heavy chain [Iris pallida]